MKFENLLKNLKFEKKNAQKKNYTIKKCKKKKKNLNLQTLKYETFLVWFSNTVHGSSKK